MDWQVVNNYRWDRNTQQMVDNEVAQNGYWEWPAKATTTPPIYSTLTESNMIEKKKKFGDELQIAVLKCNTHLSNRAAVPAGTGTVDAMEVASGPKVYMYHVPGTRTMSDPSRSAHSERRTTREVARPTATP